jgi:hypothetical protein
VVGVDQGVTLATGDQGTVDRHCDQCDGQGDGEAAPEQGAGQTGIIAPGTARMIALSTTSMVRMDSVSDARAIFTADRKGQARPQ